MGRMRAVLLLLLSTVMPVAGGCGRSGDPLAVAGAEAIICVDPGAERYLPRDEVHWIYGYQPDDRPLAPGVVRETFPVRVTVGTRVRVVMDCDPAAPPPDPGDRIAMRVLEGEHAGETLLFPRKNLRPVPSP